MLGSQYSLEKQHQKVIDRLTDRSGYADIIFITAASANHYEESLGVVKGLQDLIFPRLRREAKYSFKFLCYDLGLTRQQVNKMKEHGNCTAVIRVPFEDLPESFDTLGTCAWKPLLIQANVYQSKVTIWMDASTRFYSDDLDQIVSHTLDRGFYVSNTGWMMPQHLAVPTLSYFQVQPCLMSPFKEMAGGFLAVHNNQLMRQAVLAPWVSCAFSPQCLCPGKNCYERLKPCKGPGPYSRCHRFDQAVLGLILVNLFDWKATSFYGPKIYRFQRSKFRGDFPEMHLERR